MVQISNFTAVVYFIICLHDPVMFTFSLSDGFNSLPWSVFSLCFIPQAFHIVNKELEYSNKGFSCTFERGILHIYFNFKVQALKFLKRLGKTGSVGLLHRRHSNVRWNGYESSVHLHI